MKESVEVARQRGIDWIDAMNEVFAPDGLSYWDRRFANDSEFLAFYLHLHTFPSEQFRTIDFLRDMAQSNDEVAKLVNEIDRSYIRAMTKQGAAA